MWSLVAEASGRPGTFGRTWSPQIGISPPGEGICTRASALEPHEAPMRRLLFLLSTGTAVGLRSRLAPYAGIHRLADRTRELGTTRESVSTQWSKGLYLPMVTARSLGPRAGSRAPLN